MTAHMLGPLSCVCQVCLCLHYKTCWFLGSLDQESVFLWQPLWDPDKGTRIFYRLCGSLRLWLTRSKACLPITAFMRPSQRNHNMQQTLWVLGSLDKVPCSLWQPLWDTGKGTSIATDLMGPWLTRQGVLSPYESLYKTQAKEPVYATHFACPQLTCQRACLTMTAFMRHSQRNRNMLQTF